MGKSKTRILRKGINQQIPTISRQEAIEQVVGFLKNGITQEATQIITMFGLEAEEILEAGADYESVTVIKNIFK